MAKRRHLIQTIGFLALNGNLKGFFEGRIYQGSLKQFCVPALNCYACPGALGSCPIGSMQAVMNSPKFNIPYFAMGLVTLFGLLLGRVYCGYLCPFGLFQDLLAKIPSKKFRLPKFVRIIPYAILAVFVFALPLFLVDKFGMSDPAYCKYICPSGTLFAGIPLLLTNPLLRSALGWLFSWKMMILVAVSLLSIIVPRFFCKTMCPLGALFGIFNPISFYRLQVDEACISCKACTKACPMDLKPHKTPNHPACIRCHACVDTCPVGAIHGNIPALLQQGKQSY